MIAKFFRRGTGGGKGPTEYLTKADGAEVLRGDPKITERLIDSIENRHKYTSGVLSFEENIGPSQADEIINSFEKTLLPGLLDKTDRLWVKHNEHNRTELHFVIPKIDLNTGQQVQPYFHGSDKKRVNDWKDIINHDYQLSDPSAPDKQRAAGFSRDLPRDKHEAVQMINSALAERVGAGDIQNRDDVTRALTDAGIEIARETKSSISIKPPEGGKNIRLTGEIYQRDFKFSEETQSRIETEQREYQAGAGERIEQARDRLAKFTRIKLKSNEAKHGNSRADGLATHSRIGLDNVRSPDINQQNAAGGTERDKPEHKRSEGPRLDPTGRRSDERDERRADSNYSEKEAARNNDVQREPLPRHRVTKKQLKRELENERIESKIIQLRGRIDEEASGADKDIDAISSTAAERARADKERAASVGSVYQESQRSAGDSDKQHQEIKRSKEAERGPSFSR